MAVNVFSCHKMLNRWGVLLSSSTGARLALPSASDLSYGNQSANGGRAEREEAELK